jgi:hypothetical protein
MSSSSQEVIIYFNGTFMEKLNGAHARMDSFLRFLLRHFERVIVYSFRNHPTCPWTDDLVKRFAAEYPRARLVLEQRTGWLFAMTRLKNTLTVFLPSFGETDYQDESSRCRNGLCVALEGASGRRANHQLRGRTYSVEWYSKPTLRG